MVQENGNISRLSGSVEVILNPQGAVVTIITHQDAMNCAKTIKDIRKNFAAGIIPLDELLLHVEPLLTEATSDAFSQAEAKRIVNAIERAIYTQTESQISSVILDLLEQAERLQHV